MSWLGAGPAWCVKCNTERPSIKRGKARICLVCKDPVAPRPSKYGNKPTKSKFTLGRNGKPRTFQSKKEANREPVLLALQNVGEIKGLTYQQPFRLELYGTQAVDALLLYLDTCEPGPDGEWAFEKTWFGRLINEVRRSRQCVGKWLADYSYTTKSGELIVEDVKGRPTPVYSLKKKLVLVACGLEIQEPKEGGVQQRARGCGIRGRGTGARLLGGR